MPRQRESKKINVWNKNESTTTKRPSSILYIFYFFLIFFFWWFILEMKNFKALLRHVFCHCGFRVFFSLLILVCVVSVDSGEMMGNRCCHHTPNRVIAYRAKYTWSLHHFMATNYTYVLKFMTATYRFSFETCRNELNFWVFSALHDSSSLQNTSTFYKRKNHFCFFFWMGNGKISVAIIAVTATVATEI